MYQILYGIVAAGLTISIMVTVVEYAVTRVVKSYRAIINIINNSEPTEE